ncbi:adenosylcobinamide-GDP ribazoletransferase [Gymnodinialimonas sp. 2305UL16-5]|uniref:adenosylcobinamide-GDP ribazoletransferase n=1 Tax=Gymnodinialimonas mytili TaxID=3126503 RepID=UPI003094B0A0
MSDPDSPFPQPKDLIRAVHLLTRVPLPGGDGARAAASAWAWPLVGAGLAVAQICVGLGALALNIPVIAAAGLAVAVGIILIGALHEDGFADCADGFWGGHTVERRLDILKDSRIGAYGVVALILAIGLRWSLFVALLPVAPLALIASAMLSRAAMATLMAALPFARADGLASHVGRPPIWAALVGGGLAGIAAIVLTGAAGIAAALAVIGTMLAMGALARAKIGGQTGDVLGATQVMGDLAALLTLAAMLA